jgi:serine/threonine protein phosphatase PrpC
MRLETAALTDTGPDKEVNEDTVRVTPWAGGQLLVVADGMGGHRAGDVASEEAVETFVRGIEEQDERTDVARNADTERALVTAVERANDTLQDVVTEHPEYEGMGTTLVAAVVENDSATLVNVGDSRAYHVTPDSIEQITVDQSLVRELVEQGTVSEAEADGHPYSNVLSQALGTEESVDADTYDLTVQGTLLLCSDGLSDVVSAAEIRETVAEGSDLESIGAALVDRARDNDGDDDVSVALARRA